MKKKLISTALAMSSLKNPFEVADFASIEELTDYISSHPITHKNPKLFHFGINTRSKDGVPPTKGIALRYLGGTELNPALVNCAYLYLKKIGHKTPKARIGLENTEASVKLLDYLATQKAAICFHLNQMDKDYIRAIVTQNETFSTGFRHGKPFCPVLHSTAAQELYHLYCNWEQFSDYVSFLKNFQRVAPPWNYL